MVFFLRNVLARGGIIKHLRPMLAARDHKAAVTATSQSGVYQGTEGALMAPDRLPLDACEQGRLVFSLVGDDGMKGPGQYVGSRPRKHRSKKGDLPASGYESNGTTLPKSSRLREATVLLLEAFEFARELERPAWDFAVEIQSLRRVGLTNNDFRWLICKGYVEHGLEITRGHESSRAFRRRKGLIFGRRTCFVLTQEGVDFSRRAIREIPRDQNGQAANGKRPDLVANNTEVNDSQLDFAAKLVPKWDRDRQELRLGGCIVKQFKVPALNQERILAVFEEEGWPVRIDDPLTPQNDQDPKRRLHDTINSLNRNQKRRLIRFMGDGTGEGVRWCLLEPGEDAATDTSPA